MLQILSFSCAPSWHRWNAYFSPPFFCSFFPMSRFTEQWRTVGGLYMRGFSRIPLRGPMKCKSIIQLYGTIYKLTFLQTALPTPAWRWCASSFLAYFTYKWTVCSLPSFDFWHKIAAGKSSSLSCQIWLFLSSSSAPAPSPAPALSSSAAATATTTASPLRSDIGPPPAPWLTPAAHTAPLPKHPPPPLSAPLPPAPSPLDPSNSGATSTQPARCQVKGFCQIHKKSFPHFV